ncbi:MAG: hypothetical protein ABIK09_08085 [Pseudomonadota bacterium]
MGRRPRARHVLIALCLATLGPGCSGPGPHGAPEDAAFDTAAEVLTDVLSPGDAAVDRLEALDTTPELLPDPDIQGDVVLPRCPTGLPDFVTVLGGGGFLVEQPGWDLYVTVLASGIIRLRWLDTGTSPDVDLSYAVVPQEALEADIEAAGDASCTHLVIETGLLQAVIGPDGAAVAQGGAAPFYAAPSRPARDPVTGAVTATRLIAPTDHYYGFGEKTGPLDKNGRTLTFWNFDPLAWGDYTTASEPIYQSIPAYVGLRDGVAFGGVHGQHAPHGLRRGGRRSRHLDHHRGRRVHRPVHLRRPHDPRGGGAIHPPHRTSGPSTPLDPGLPPVPMELHPGHPGQRGLRRIPGPEDPGGRDLAGH